MPWSADEVQQLVTTGHSTHHSRRRPTRTYQVVKVEGADGGGRWPVFYELQPGVDASAIASEADLHGQTFKTYDYYAWISGAKALCNVVKTIGGEQ